MPWPGSCSPVAKFGLGRGLGALIPERQPYYEAAAGSGGQASLVTTLPLAALRPNPDQPRKHFAEGSLDDLAASILRHGLLQPILAEEDGDGGYTIVAGERRYRAALKAGLVEVPVILRRLSSEKRLEISLIENIQREDLNPLEEARAYQSLMELGGATQDQVAEAVGKSRSTVANALRLLRLPELMLTALRDGQISAGHARSLLALPDAAAREKLFRRILDEGLSVRQAEAAVQEAAAAAGRVKTAKPAHKAGESEGLAQSDPELRAVQDRLIEAFGTKVTLRGDGKRGQVVMEYYSMEDLQRILDVAGVGDT
jgi:ParB family chromosome partitioning protein